MKLLDPIVWSGKIFSDGWRSANGGVYDVREPATGEVIGTTATADASDMASACASASEAQPGWAATSFAERAAVLRRAGLLWEKYSSEVDEWIIRESGSVRRKAAHETRTAAEECFEAAALTSHPSGEVMPSAHPRLSFSNRVPVGVVGVIAPFNFPLILGIRSVAPALALGNAVVLKPDPRTAVCGGISIARVFEEAGLPSGVLHVLPGGLEAGEALVDGPHVPVISFTGSTAAGRRIGERAGRLLKRVHLELGSNAALIVMEDSDLELAASAGAWGSFQHQGQICMSTGRHLVHERVAEEYVDRLTAKAKRLRVGNPATDGTAALGPIIDEKQRNKIQAIVESSIEAGAKLTVGGQFEGPYYPPTVLTGVLPSMAAYSQEIFGPVAPITTFGDLEEAVSLAKDTEYGMSLGILSRDVAAAIALADRLRVGMVHINDQTVNDEPAIPFGGIGASGTGARFGGAAANIEAFTDTRWTTIRGAIAPYPY